MLRRPCALILLSAAACSPPSYNGGERDASMELGEASAPRDAASLTDGTSAFAVSDAAASDAGAVTDAQAAPNDAAMPDTSTPDTSVPNPVDVSSASLLRGDYLVRTRFYQQDDGNIVKLTHEMLHLGRITGDGALAITMEICRETAKLRAPLTAYDGQTALPHKWPARKGRVVVDSPLSFHAEMEPYIVGYGATPNGCTPGATIASSAPWLSGSCDCPYSEQTLPAKSSDCRVIDDDGDMKPGATIHLVTPVESFDHVRTRDSSQIVKGEIARNRQHRALYARSEEFFTYTCTSDLCASGAPRECAQSTSSVEFAPLAAGQTWDCASALAALGRGELLPVAEPPFPSGC